LIGSHSPPLWSPSPVLQTSSQQCRLSLFTHFCDVSDGLIFQYELTYLVIFPYISELETVKLIQGFNPTFIPSKSPEGGITEESLRAQSSNYSCRVANECGVSSSDVYLFIFILLQLLKLMFLLAYLHIS
jgi:hypothetical protein